MTYKLKTALFTNEVNAVLHVEKEMYIPFDPNNNNYQEYLAWLAEGNTPTPADEP